jgi:hypothetical protein
LRQRPCPCCGACSEDYPEARAALEADHIVGLGNMVEVAREGKP